ncbi:hypothetical protein H6F54_09335 [Coleofasciculus sp. FACHB-501]|nr:hypothetical protein [Coleofasciculus sp. FACHB-501]
MEYFQANRSWIALQMKLKDAEIVALIPDPE